MCPDGVIGRTCDVRTACFENPCGEGNTCQFNEADTSLFECTCQAGWLGELCTIEDVCVADEKVFEHKMQHAINKFKESVHAQWNMFNVSGDSQV